MDGNIPPLTQFPALAHKFATATAYWASETILIWFDRYLEDLIVVFKRIPGYLQILLETEQFGDKLRRTLNGAPPVWVILFMNPE